MQWLALVMAYFALMHACTSDNLKRYEVESMIRAQLVDEYEVRNIVRSECQCH